MNTEHDFRPPPITPEEFREHLEKVINLIRGDRNFEQLAWTCRYQLNGLTVIYDSMTRGLEKKDV